MSFGERADEVREEEEDQILDDPDLNPLGDMVPEDEEEKQYEFPEQHVEPFKGLMFLGALTDEFNYVGHKIIIRTLTTDEVLAIGLMVKRYEGTQGYMKAYAAAVVAASVVSIDGRNMPIPIGKSKDEDALIRHRFNYVKSRWYPWTIDFIFDKFLALEDRVREVYVEMGKAQS